MLENLPFTISSLKPAYLNGLKPAALVAEVYRRINQINDDGIFIHLISQDTVLEEANDLGSVDYNRKPLWGIPFVIKDNINAKGTPTTAACPDYSYVSSDDAFVVKILREAGALLIGKTNLDQFATGLVGLRSPYPIPKNAVDPAIVPGGSSSGSAVAVGHGFVSFSLGTDTAGSGRVPAALNNIVGLKPTLGLISATGLVPACRTLDTISIFALSVPDAYDVLKIATKFDSSDAYARDIKIGPLGSVPPQFKVGVPNKATIEFFGDDVQASSYYSTLESLKEEGAEIIELDFTAFFDVADMLYEGAWVAERYSVIEDMLKSNPDAIHPITRQIVEKAEDYNSADVFRGFYRLKELSRIAMTLVESVDMLCVPTIPTFYSVADLEKDPIGPNSRFGTYTNFVNFLDLCGIAVPVAKRLDGRPGGVTLLAEKGRDGQIAAVASKLHSKSGATLGATDWTVPALENELPTANTHETALAAVGAHMSGLPLNHELTKLGARFLYAAKTAPLYSLFSLAGGPPFRPGLIRGETGSSIEIEVWALPTKRVGEFIQGIPHPLGIGTLKLENGENVKGFICEPCATTTAEDVTKFGGWRAFLNATTFN
jgi:allophanate hydrolase